MTARDRQEIPDHNFRSNRKKANQLEETMLARLNRRGVVASFFATAAIAALTVPASAQAPAGQPITIGFSMALTGPLAAHRKQALLGANTWGVVTITTAGLLG